MKIEIIYSRREWDSMQHLTNFEIPRTEDNRSTASSSKSDDKTFIGFGNSFGTSGGSSLNNDPMHFFATSGVPPPVPSTEPPALNFDVRSTSGNNFIFDASTTNSNKMEIDAEGFSQNPETSKSKEKQRWSSCSSDSSGIIH